jgi:hypothetical protein
MSSLSTSSFTNCEPFALASLNLLSSSANCFSSRTFIEQSAVAIIDTLEGRLVAEHVASAGKNWMIIAPGTKSNVASAINHMVRRLPADEEWHSYRKVV